LIKEKHQLDDHIRKFVLERIEKNHKLPKGAAIESFNYIDSGYIDSMGIVKFIIEIETEFDMNIQDSEIDSDEFRKIGGLISLIKKKILAKKADSD